MAFKLIIVVQIFCTLSLAQTFQPVNPQTLPRLTPDGDLQSFQKAVKGQVDLCLKQNLREKFHFGKKPITRKQWCVNTGREFLKLASQSKDLSDLMTQAKYHFTWYKSAGDDGRGNVLFTGYYTPTLEASSAPTSNFNVPLYGRPANLVESTLNGTTTWQKQKPDGSFELFDDRKMIDEDGSLRGLNLEIAYSNDWFSVFILHVQGSGILTYAQPDGSVRKQFVDFTATNGRPYVSIRRYMNEHLGVPLEQLSIPGIRKYFKVHPNQLHPILDQNPSYVFFKLAGDGPYGREGLLLTPRHSAAVDPKFYPMGSIVFFRSQHSLMDGDNEMGLQDFTGLAVAQDVGGAIKGPGRLDYYWGDDNFAEQMAGKMANSGTIYIPIKEN